MNDPSLTEVHGELAYSLSSDRVRLFVTPRCGMMGPVYFNLGKREVQPYSLPPWLPQDLPDDEIDLMKVLRGDFFCLPFGVSQYSEYPHGECANLKWELIEQSDSKIALNIHCNELNADIQKRIFLGSGETAVYFEHEIRGLDGNYSFGTHAILSFADESGACPVTTDTLKFGQVLDENIDGPEAETKSRLLPGARFETINSIPAQDNTVLSMENYPEAQPSEDLVMFSHSAPIAWTAVKFNDYIWISLKRTVDFPSTLFWMTNGGRDNPPWNGEHSRRLGIEEVCSYFHMGLEASREDRLAADDIPTSKHLIAGKPTV